MRLTLRTLLAYIDDTLDPAQAREIGQKVAESDVAQELIERIKTVTRRRGLTVPPASGPDKIDANTVAEYLDSDLSPEMIAEVEEMALNSDVHLAEIAACHQILTLVVGEPATIPPVARQRMYQLVKGPESDSSRRAKRTGPPRDPSDSAALIDHQAAQRGAMYRLIGAGAVAIAFAIALWQILHNLPHRGGALPGDLPVAPAVADANSKPADHPADTPKPEVKPPDKPKPEVKPETPKPEPKPEPPKQPIDQPRDRTPSNDRVNAGTLVSKDAVVLTRGEKTWTRIAPETAVMTGAPLLVLAGYHAEIRSDSGAKLLLWGNLPDWLPGGFLDCQVALNAPPAGFDLDLTLDRGRIYLVGAKKPTPVRLRFAGEIWDVTLADDTTEIVVDVVAAFAGEPFVRDGKGESPLMQAQLGVVSGQVTAQVESRKIDLRAAPGTCGLVWENKKAGFTTLELMSPLPTWAMQPIRPMPRERQQEIETALRSLMTRIATPNKPVDLAIAEIADAGTPVGKSLAVLAAGALCACPPVLDALEDGQSPELRQTAALALQELIARRPEFDTQVYEQLQAKLGYLERQADETMTLLHGVSEAGRNDPATYDLLFSRLRAERIGERELAAWRLAQLDPEGAVRARYRAGDPEVQRERAITEWRKRIPEGKLPPGRP
jgi:hypothetical protein